MTLRTIDPSTGKPLATYPQHTDGEVERRLATALEAFRRWSATPIERRCEALRAVAARLRAGTRAHAERIVREMGKPIREAEAEVTKCAWALEHFAEHAPAMLAPEPVATDAARSYVRFDPLGPVLAIMPWNFPYWQVIRCAAPALAAGDVVCLKHAESVTGCALALEGLFLEAVPEGVFQTLLLPSSRVAPVIAHPAIRAVTLTGSERAGMAVAEAAGRALKKTVLELGGSDPFIVLDDADIPSVAREAARVRTINSGQSCIAAKRFLVPRHRAEAFVEALRAELEALRVGDPLDPATDVGPLAREDLLEELHRLVEASVAAGARLVTGGRRLERPGFYYAPTLLADVTPEMPVATEETFGPVAPVLAYGDEEEAVRIANASRFGLGASVWTADPERGERLAARLEAGHVAVNGIVKSDPRLPFGGVKHSGYGRELGTFGIRELVNVKAVWVGPARA